MNFDQRQHHRRSLRLPGYDYSSGGAYFITICTRNRKLLFGEVDDAGIMILNDLGNQVQQEWLASEEIRKEITLGPFQVMPNHLHGTFFIANENYHHFEPRLRSFKDGRKPRSVSSFISGFKSTVSRYENLINGTEGISTWQSNFYDHIVRSEADYLRIAEYIYTNPQRWLFDAENPNRIGDDEFDLWLLNGAWRAP
ncbi:MAG: transposase [bacterium]